MTTTHRVLTLADVHAGSELPVLTYEVTATTVVVGALATRDSRPQHHDYHFATERNGVRDIFMNAPNQAAWFERYITDWTGPRGRLGKVGFRMKDSVFPGDTMTLKGTVTDVAVDEAGCGWISLDVTMHAGDRLATTGTARVAVPTTPDDNPWTRRGESWQPEQR
jgi:acyl dehydratase